MMKLTKTKCILLIISLALAATIVVRKVILSLWGDWLPDSWLVNSLVLYTSYFLGTLALGGSILFLLLIGSAIQHTTKRS